MAKQERDSRQTTTVQGFDPGCGLESGANPSIIDDLSASQDNDGRLRVTTCHESNFPESASPFLPSRISEDLGISESGSECSDPDKLEDGADFTDESAGEGVDPEDLDQMLNKMDLFGKDEVDDFGDTFGSKIFGIQNH
jgi:hypothetical protein